jgi:type VI secretion system protein ImpL
MSRAGADNERRPSGRRETSAGRLAAQADLAALQALLRQAERLLADRRQSSYDLPWYMVIGPRGAGKSAWLSGLGLACETLRESAPRHSTAACDVLIYQGAVVLDVSGRLFSQDVDPPADRRIWAGLLRLLIARRERLPLSGLIVMLPIEAVEDAEEDRAGIGDALRRRMAELGAALRGRVPVYVVVTKLDEIAGTLPLLSTLHEQETDQVWGVTFARRRPRLQDLHQGVADIVRRLAGQVVLRQHNGLDARMAGALWSLPHSLAWLKKGMVALASGIAGAPTLLLRGIYLSPHAGALHADRGTPRVPFARGLFETIILREAGLAVPPRERGPLDWALAAAVVLAVLCSASGLTYVYARQRGAMIAIEAAAAALPPILGTLAQAPVADFDPAPVLPMLAALDGLQRGIAAADVYLPPLPDRIATSRAVAVATYLRGLEVLLLPRLLLALERDLAEAPTGPAADAYAALAVSPPSAAGPMLEWLGTNPFSGLTQEDAQALARHTELLLRAATRPFAVDVRTLDRVTTGGAARGGP